MHPQEGSIEISVSEVTLCSELLAVVDQTMQPTRASLWLRPRGPVHRN